MPARLRCIGESCGAQFAIEEVLYNCPKCGGLIEAAYDAPTQSAAELKKLFRQRRMSNAPVDQSGVWRYRELFPFLDDLSDVVTLREGNTPLLDAPLAASYAGLGRLVFKHQGYNPTGSFKDNGMTCGVSQAIEYGARTLQVEANFDEILALVRVLAERLGIYLLNSMNPFRIEGQKSIVIEMMDQRDWHAPDWIVLPGGNLGNTSAFGKALRELHAYGFLDKMPRIGVIKAEGSAPFYEFSQRRGVGDFVAVKRPETLATAIRIGDPVSWPKAWREVTASNGVVEQVTEQEIADAKAQIGRCGIGCEPASAATLAGLRKLTAAGTVSRDADVVAVLTGHVLKDTDYIYRYHTGKLETPAGVPIRSTYGNQPVVVPNDPDRIAALLAE